MNEAGIIRDNGKIDQVTVYTSQMALVKRKVNVEFGKGENRLTVSGIPAGIQDSSVRVSAKGSAPLTILNINLTGVMPKKETEEKAVEIKKKLKEYQAKERKVNIKIDARKKQIEFIDKLVKAKADSEGKGMTSATPVSKPSIEELSGIFNFIYDKRVDAEMALIEEEKEKEKIKQDLDRLKYEVKHLTGGQRSREKKEVTIEFRAEDKGQGSFNVEYVVYGASWSPVYTVRAGTEDETVKLSYQAMVAQSTGEDWNDIRMKLSSAKPNAGAKAPKVEPWKIGFYKSIVGGGLQPQAMAAAAGDMDMTLGEAVLDDMVEEEFEADVVQANVDSSGVSAMFEVPVKETVLSFSDKVRVTVAELEFEPEIIYVTAPRLSEFVYLQAKFENSSEYPLLAGETNVFLEDNFLGQGSIKTISPGEEVKLDLGIDEGFKVEHKSIKSKSGSDGLIIKKGAVRKVYEIVLESYKQSAKKVKVVDHLPLPMDEKIILKQENIAPKPNKMDERNIVEWTIPIEPKEKKTIRMEYSVEHPKDITVYGLEDH